MLYLSGGIGRMLNKLRQLCIEGLKSYEYVAKLVHFSRNELNWKPADGNEERVVDQTEQPGRPTDQADAGLPAEEHGGQNQNKPSLALFFSSIMTWCTTILATRSSTSEKFSFKFGVLCSDGRPDRDYRLFEWASNSTTRYSNRENQMFK